MTLWFIIVWVTIASLGGALLYLGSRIPKFFDSEFVSNWTKIQTFLICSWTVIIFMASLTFCIGFINAIICAIYIAMIWAVSDFIFWVFQKVFQISFQHYYAGWSAIIAGILILSTGWYLNHHVWQTNYLLRTSKKIEPLKIVMFADSHMGTTFDTKSFKKHLEKMQQQNPDIVVIVGDYVDDDTTKEDMIKSIQALGQMKTKYGIYFVFGNHDKGYYGAAHRGFSLQNLVDELTKNGIMVLQDEIVQINDFFYLIGRQDYSEKKERNGHRQSMEELVKDLDKDKYTIVLDHQPTDYRNQEKADVDLVLSGHTHGGQLFPFNWVGKWIGANDSIYGHEKRGKTNFIITSGISSWAIKFKTGTKSEYVVIDIEPEE